MADLESGREDRPGSNLQRPDEQPASPPSSDHGGAGAKQASTTAMSTAFRRLGTEDLQRIMSGMSAANSNSTPSDISPELTASEIAHLARSIILERIEGQRMFYQKLHRSYLDKLRDGQKAPPNVARSKFDKEYLRWLEIGDVYWEVPCDATANE